MGRNRSIDGIRGVSVSFIVLYHMIARYAQIYREAPVSNVLLVNQWGEIFVSVFLVISTFFLFANVDNERKFSFPSFIIKKIKRLYPCYAIYITFFYLLTRLVELPGRTYSMVDYVLNMLLLNGFIGRPYIDGAHWYITTLLSITLVMGIIRSVNKQESLEAYCIWLFVLFVLKILSSILVGQNATVARLLYGVLGGEFVGIALMGIALHWFLNVTEKNGAVGVQPFVLFLCGVMYSVVEVSIWRLVGAIVGVLVVWLSYVKPDNLLFNNRLFVMVGAISYPLFLCHQNIGFWIQYQLQKCFNTYSMLFVVPAVAISLLFATALQKCERIFTTS